MNLLLPDHTGHHRPDVEPHPKLERWRSAHDALHGEGHLGQGVDVRRSRLRQSGRDHVRVSDRLDLLESVCERELIERREDVVQETDEIFRRHGLRQQRESGDIGEQYPDLRTRSAITDSPLFNRSAIDAGSTFSSNRSERAPPRRCWPSRPGGRRSNAGACSTSQSPRRC